MLEDLTDQLEEGVDLTAAQMGEALERMMSNRVTDEEIALFLLALSRKGETADEVAGAAQVIRAHMTPIKTRHEGHLDTCGTGGDGLSTFNISTAAALVVAAAGVPVAKHGNRGVTSKSGSADVLSTLGVRIEADLDLVQRCLNELGICFCFAPLMHPSLKRVAMIRRQLGVPTIFNWLGPLCNPASAPFQLMGVGKPSLRRLMAQVHQLLGTRKAVIVCGADGLDEITIETETYVSIATPERIEEAVWKPEQFGIKPGKVSDLRVSGPAESAEVIRHVLSGKTGPHRDIVVANAAAALWAVGMDRSLESCGTLAAQAIDDGRVQQLLRDLCHLTSAGAG